MEGGAALVPLRVLCEQHIRQTLGSMDQVEQSCAAQTARLEQRKDALLVELATLSDSLEDISLCARNVREARQALLEDVAELIGEDAAASLAAHPIVGMLDASRPIIQKAEQTTLANHTLGATSMDESLQVHISNLRGAVSPSQISEAIDGRLGTGACQAVKLCAGGRYAFATLRDRESLNAALALGGEPIDTSVGIPLVLEKVSPSRGSQPRVQFSRIERSTSSGASHLQVQQADVGDPSAGASKTDKPMSLSVTGNNLESKIYWALRAAPPPKPCEKEFRENMAFFKQTNRFAKGKTVIYDVCGSHGALGALFLAYGRVSRAVVLDKFCPASFANVRDALAPFWDGKASSSTAGDSAGPVSRGSKSNGPNGTVVSSIPIAQQHPAATTAPDVLASDTCSPCKMPVPLVHIECDMRKALPAMLDSEEDPSSVLVVGVHCCNQLTDDVINICTQRGVDFMVMPCCQVRTGTCAVLPFSVRTRRPHLLQYPFNTPALSARPRSVDLVVMR
mgnify:CR=1 FL=1